MKRVLMVMACLAGAFSMALAGCITTTTTSPDGTVTEERRVDIGELSLIISLVTNEGMNLIIKMKELLSDDDLDEAERELRLAEIQSRQAIISGIIDIAIEIIVGELTEIEMDAAFSEISVGMDKLDL